MNYLLRGVLSITMLLLLQSMPVFAAEAAQVQNVVAITKVYPDGQKVIAAAVEYDKIIDHKALNNTDFSVDGRTVERVYANTTAETANESVDGKYVIVQLSDQDANAGLFVQKGRIQQKLPAEVVVHQLQTIKAVDGMIYPLRLTGLKSNRVITPIADDFKQLVYKDEQTGLTEKYNLFVPKNYDAKKTYPLVLFMHDASVTGPDTKMTLLQGDGALVWASAEEQAKHPCFVLAPQYTTEVVNDNAEATSDLDATVHLIQELEKQYAIDTKRIYATGQSGGCMMSIAMNIKYPKLFAASYLVAGQWDAEKMLGLANKKFWITVSEGDIKAYPGMNESLSLLAKHDAKISQAKWNAHSTQEQFAGLVKDLAQMDSNIKYTVLEKGTVVPANLPDNPPMNHMYTWKNAYEIPGIRDWIFAQSE